MQHIGLSIVIGSALIACGIALNNGFYAAVTSGNQGIFVHRINKWNGEIITCALGRECKPINEY